jgi:NTE family protein
VSIGALIALLYALDYSVAQMKDIALGLDFSQLQHVDEETVFSITENYGIDDGAAVRSWLEGLLAARALRAGATFADLKARWFIDLRVYACRLRDAATVEFSARRTPTIPIVDALMASIAVPLYFAPVRIGGELYVDGGTTDNYPMAHFSAAEQRSTLGFVFKKDLAMFYKNATESFLSYGTHLIRVMGHDRYKGQIQHYRDATVLVDCGAMGVLDFQMGTEAKEALLGAGRRAVEAWLSGSGGSAGSGAAANSPKKPARRRWSIS